VCNEHARSTIYHLLWVAPGSQSCNASTCPHADDQIGHCSSIYVIGSSGGACAGGLLFAADVSIEDMVYFICECCADARMRVLNRLKIPQYLREAIQRFCPDNIAELVAGKMEVSVTKVGFATWWRFCFPWCWNIRWSGFSSKARSAYEVGAAGDIHEYRCRMFRCPGHGKDLAIDMVNVHMLAMTASNSACFLCQTFGTVSC
jgi:hypothetical protein